LDKQLRLKPLLLTGSLLLTFWERPSIPSSGVFFHPLTLQDGTDRMPWNVDNQLPINAVLHPRRAETSFTL